MSDFEDKLNQVLSSPDTMEQIMSLARSLGVGNSQATPLLCQNHSRLHHPHRLPCQICFLSWVADQAKTAEWTLNLRQFCSGLHLHGMSQMIRKLHCSMHYVRF